MCNNYLTSTVAPAASNCSLILAPSSAGTSFLISAGVLSTKPLASTNPNPVISLTALTVSYTHLDVYKRQSLDGPKILSQNKPSFSGF